ncbi:hypothetical protein LH128_05193 [Sphingomonas sp. LH128]|jgi:hypothetical protein|uniref:hypothetical protein n=1 Tax=Sphingomonas sp. LH128 TaxID=473781 RepID=UPI00027C9B1A|nr:hypothetical protein [Sphingomonas sp. LH128]EJU14127.1 hypothetical protein LH128_05193 [Sphingomonas sp. LH128]
MALQAVAGSKIYIGTRVALPTDLTVDLTDFAPQETEWLQINGWTNAGALGDAREAISQNFIDADRTETIKGTKNAAEMQNVFAPDYSDPGQNRLRQAVDDCSNYAFKIEWGAGCAANGPVTISVATPGVVTWPGGHGLKAGSPVIFAATGGTLPTGLTAGTVYYVVAAGLTPTTFSVSATPGGAAIATTAAGTATSITATAQPAGRTVMFYGIALSASENGGEANTAQMGTHSIKPNTNLVRV